MIRSTQPVRPRRARIASLATSAAAVVALLTACSSGSDSDAGDKGTGDAVTKVNFVFDWIPTAGDVPVLAAQKFGWFADEGLDVKVSPGGPEVSGATLVSAGQQDIGIVPPTGVMAARANGAPIVSVGVTQPTGPTGLVCSPDVGIDPNDPTTLDGHKIGFGTKADDAIMLKWFADNGVDVDSIKRVPSGFDGSLMFAGTLDCQQNFLTNVPIQVADHYGKDAVVFKTSADTGAVGQSIVTNESYLADHEAAVQGFLTAYAKGMQWALENVDDAVALVKESYPEYDEAQLKVELPMLETFWTSDETKQNGLLSFDESTLKPTYDIIEGTEWLEKDIDLSKAYSTVALPDPPVMP